MIRSLFDHLPDLRIRIAAANHVLLGLDFDGTLAPIVDRPDAAALSPAVRETLRTLTERRDVTVAIVSGRALDDVRRRVDVDGLYYAGNHGLDIAGPGCERIDDDATRQRASLAEIADDLANRLACVPGAAVEDKSLTLSVHYRGVADDRRDDVRRIVESTARRLTDPCRIVDGDCVWEIRPMSRWHKGTALGWIRNRIDAADVLSIYFGDDRTDEDAFRAVAGGVAVKVGDPGLTSAAYAVDSTANVAKFLNWFAAITEARTPTPPNRSTA